MPLLIALLLLGLACARTCLPLSCHAATTGGEAVELARQTQPDVVIMDLRMPGLNGIEATRRILADSPHIAVLVLSMFDDDDSIFSAAGRRARVPAQGRGPGPDPPRPPRHQSSLS